MDTSEVMKSILDNENVTYSVFAKNIGASAKEIYDMLNGRTKSITRKFADKILSVYPHYSRIWLLTGIGEMCMNRTALAVGDIASAEGDDVNPSSFTGSLVYNIDGTCGPSNRDFNFVQECVIGSINLPGFDSKMPIVLAVEDSMIPRINPNDYVGLQEVSNWEVIFWGKPYFVITQDYRMFKILNKCKDDQECVILHSVNSDFEDIQMKKSEILKLFIVKKVLSLRTEVM